MRSSENSIAISFANFSVYNSSCIRTSEDAGGGGAARATCFRGEESIRHDQSFDVLSCDNHICSHPFKCWLVFAVQ
jgi:hypothetical protein